MGSTHWKPSFSYVNEDGLRVTGQLNLFREESPGREVTTGDTGRPRRKDETLEGQFGGIVDPFELEIVCFVQYLVPLALKD